MKNGSILLTAALLLLSNAVWGFSNNRRPSNQLVRLLQTFKSGDITFKSERLMNYFDLPVFLVIGASEDRSKFGNKVLRCMISHDKMCIPFNKRLSEVEGLQTVSSLSTFAVELYTMYPLVSVSNVGMNLITPPPVTLTLMRQGYEIGIRNFFCQPGTIDKAVEVKKSYQFIVPLLQSKGYTPSCFYRTCVRFEDYLSRILFI